jgi:hypothetical protein
MTTSVPDWDRERRDIIDLTLRYAAGIDRRDWAMLRSCFADVFELDTASWSGTPLTSRSADEFVAGVRQTNGGFDATQHLVTNHLVERLADAEARCSAEVRAMHWFAPATLRALRPGAVERSWCEIGGHYNGVLLRDGDQWRIRRWVFTVRWRDGDESLFELARTRDVERG